MTTLVVDGYNAVYAIPETREALKKSLLDARRAILDLAKQYARTSGCIDDVKVVFDGDDRYRYLDKFDLSRTKSQVFSRTGGGDEKIIEMIKVCSRNGKVVLASNDNYVRNNARAYGAGIMDVRELAVKKSKKIKSCRTGETKELDRDTCNEITRDYRKKLGF